ncbi:hypothetical protein EJB05_16276, partial [Eragrostis curvula]
MSTDGEPRWNMQELKHSFDVAKEASPSSELWTGGLICAFEFVRSRGLASPTGLSRNSSVQSKDLLPAMDGSRKPPPVAKNLSDGSDDGDSPYCCDDDDIITVADVAAPYWQRPAGPTWWCHVTAGHPAVDAWLAAARWLHPAVSVALRDETMLISEKMKHLLYEVPVRVSGGLLFELLGQSVGDSARDEDDIPIVLRAWQTQNFLITVLHVKGAASNVNVIGVTEVQELLSTCCSVAPKSIHEVIAHLACRLARWDDRLWRKYVFGAADEIELKFVNRRNQEDLNMLCIIFNQDIRRLATQVIRVKWSLHARDEIIFELLKYLGGNTTKSLLQGVKKDTRQMIEEQEAVRGRLFTIQDVMQSTVRAWLQINADDRQKPSITHNLTIFGGCGLILSIITGLFGINVDGIPGAKKTSYAFALFSGLLFLVAQERSECGSVVTSCPALKKTLRRHTDQGPLQRPNLSTNTLLVQSLIGVKEAFPNVEAHNVTSLVGNEIVVN